MRQPIKPAVLRRWQGIEAEFDEPLRDILTGMRDQGASWDTVAGALNVPVCTLKRWRCWLDLSDGRYIRDLRQARRTSDERAQALGYADLLDGVRDCRLTRRLSWHETAEHLGVGLSTITQRLPDSLKGDLCISAAGRAAMRENGRRRWNSQT